MSTKQLARTVQDGKKVHFRWHPDADGHEGYLCGMDDFHWMIVTPEGQQLLIHKGGAPIIEIALESTYDAEDNHDSLECIVAPFRDYLTRSNLIRSA